MKYQFITFRKPELRAPAKNKKEDPTELKIKEV